MDRVLAKDLKRGEGMEGDDKKGENREEFEEGIWVLILREEIQKS